jgi:DNA-binding CsgD family transcriptional regulator
VLKLIAAEHSNQEVADKLFISIRTVDTHRRNLLEKLKLKNNAGLVRYAIKNGLTE